MQGAALEPCRHGRAIFNRLLLCCSLPCKPHNGQKEQHTTTALLPSYKVHHSLIVIHNLQASHKVFPSVASAMPGGIRCKVPNAMQQPLLLQWLLRLLLQVT